MSQFVLSQVVNPLHTTCGVTGYGEAELEAREHIRVARTVAAQLANWHLVRHLEVIGFERLKSVIQFASSFLHAACGRCPCRQAVICVEMTPTIDASCPASVSLRGSASALVSPQCPGGH
jgi:hypothetical protein